MTPGQQTAVARGKAAMRHDQTPDRPQTSRGTVLITGCSSGIGHDAAHYLTRRGWRVLATCRKPGDAERLRGEGLESFVLDLDHEALVAAGAAEAVARGPVTALINNGAFALPGAVEDLPRGGLRALFETNLFGTHDLTRAMIPHFRAEVRGRIINVSSILGLIAARWRGAYIASKFALEGLTDTLRLEMRGTGIDVVLVEPGPIESRIRANSIPHFERWIDWEASPRAEQYRRQLRRRLYEPSGPDRFQLPARAVSEVLARALETSHPRARYRVTTPTHAVAVARRLLPTSALDWLARRG